MRGLHTPQTLLYLHCEGRFFQMARKERENEMVRLCYGCDKPVAYDDETRRQYHLDGSDNSECWELIQKITYPKKCSACGKPSIYRLDEDRFYHKDGSENRTCWWKVNTGNG